MGRIEGAEERGGRRKGQKKGQKRGIRHFSPTTNCHVLDKQRAKIPVHTPRVLKTGTTMSAVLHMAPLFLSCQHNVIE